MHKSPLKSWCKKESNQEIERVINEQETGTTTGTGGAEAKMTEVQGASPPVEVNPGLRFFLGMGMVAGFAAAPVFALNGGSKVGFGCDRSVIGNGHLGGIRNPR